MGSIITYTHSGEFSKTKRFLNDILNKDYRNILDDYGRKGVQALADATPEDTGITANSWNYNITEMSDGSFTISWFNEVEVANARGYSFNLAVLLEYGHATRSGTWVSGRHFVSDAMNPVLDQLEAALMKEFS